MSDWTGNDEEQREALINDLVDGELSPSQLTELEAAASKDPALSQALGEARQLRQLLAGMPRREAPRRLRRKLLAIPGGSSSRLSPAWWPRIGIAAACLLAAVILLDGRSPEHPSLDEIQQGRRDLVVALGYLDKAGRRARMEIDTRIDSALVEPVTDHTAAALSLTPVLNEEYKL